MHIAFLHGQLPLPGCDNGSSVKTTLKTNAAQLHSQIHTVGKKEGGGYRNWGWGWYFQCHWREKSPIDGGQIEYSHKIAAVFRSGTQTTKTERI